MAHGESKVLHALRRNWISIAFALLSLALFAYPAVSSVLRQWQQMDYVRGARSTVDESGDPKRLQQLANAWAYMEKTQFGWEPNNEGMSGGHGSEADIVASEAMPEDVPYEAQLDWKPSGVISVIEIPAIGVELPIFHGTTDSVLSMGAGHVETSSLPVGGKSSKCAISGHSGLSTARMFDDLRDLKSGDVIVLRTLGDCYAYSVRTIDKMVDPDDLPQFLEPEAGRDMIVLFTCTPYTVNSHRLVVMAERVPYEPNDPALDFNVGKVLVNDLTRPLLIALGVSFGVWLVTMFVARKRIYGARKATLTDGSAEDAGQKGE